MRNLILVLIIFVASCTEPDFVNDSQILNKNVSNEINDFNEDRLTSSEKLRLDFAKALGLAMKQSVSLRNLIKEEALKKFNRDYDVLYLVNKYTTKIELG